MVQRINNKVERLRAFPSGSRGVCCLRFAQPLFYKSEFSVAVCTLLFRKDALDYIPVLCNLTVHDTEEVVVGSVGSTKITLANGKHEITLANHLVQSIIFHLYTSLGHIRKCCSKSVKTISYSRIMLNVVVPVEVLRQLLRMLSHKHVLYEILGNLLILFSLLHINNLRGAVNHSVF